MAEVHFVKNNPFFKNDGGRHFRRKFVPTSASSNNISVSHSSNRGFQHTQTIVQSASFSSLSALTAQDDSATYLRVYNQSVSNNGTMPRLPSSAHPHDHHIAKSISLEHSYSHGAIANLHLDENENETSGLNNGRFGMSQSYMEGLYVRTGEEDMMEERRSGSPTLSCKFYFLRLTPDGLKPNRLKLNRLKPNGLKPEGLKPNGLKPNGLTPDG